DGQETMSYYIDLLESAAKHHLLVNFHGATVPRGWQRTYPNLMSVEGVYGAEWYNNAPILTNRAAAHNATLPFTRNVIGPMDYTPCTFSDSQHPHITSHGHELALTVLFESGIQHLADRPESYLAQPAEVLEFFSTLPSTWDETKLLAGYPGNHTVIARRKGSDWYIAGINGTDEPMEVTPDYSPVNKGEISGTMFTDSGKPDNPWSISSITSLPEKINMQPRGGFVIKMQ
ncbi:glycoside hydrolase family 97 catalytic domain-containing protein, partial [uncultured Muribaculum sp.]|uniref:glycoside hydrolase family 97 catalytic domain-containing protein n=1 Tax=uncultured Muribaculum sp. TaxID=1918613 RepID=UPI002711D6F4